MGAQRKSWNEKLYSGARSEIKRLNKPFAGHEIGQLMLIPTPLMIDSYIRSIPKGVTKSIKEMRQELAVQNNVDLVCPVCTGIFTRIVAEAANEALVGGTNIDRVAPFWRVLEPKGSLRSKASFDLRMADQLIADEANL